MEARENYENLSLSGRLCPLRPDPHRKWSRLRPADPKALLVGGRASRLRFLNRPRGTVESVGNEFDKIHDLQSSVDFLMFIVFVLRDF